MVERDKLANDGAERFQLGRLDIQGISLQTLFRSAPWDALADR